LSSGVTKVSLGAGHPEGSEIGGKKVWRRNFGVTISATTEDEGNISGGEKLHKKRKSVWGNNLPPKEQARRGTSPLTAFQGGKTGHECGRADRKDEGFLGQARLSNQKKKKRSLKGKKKYDRVKSGVGRELMTKKRGRRGSSHGYPLRGASRMPIAQKGGSEHEGRRLDTIGGLTGRSSVRGSQKCQGGIDRGQFLWATGEAGKKEKKTNKGQTKEFQKCRTQ